MEISSRAGSHWSCAHSSSSLNSHKILRNRMRPLSPLSWYWLSEKYCYSMYFSIFSLTCPLTSHNKKHHLQQLPTSRNMGDPRSPGSPCSRRENMKRSTWVRFLEQWGSSTSCWTTALTINLATPSPAVLWENCSHLRRWLTIIFPKGIAMYLGKQWPFKNTCTIKMEWINKLSIGTWKLMYVTWFDVLRLWEICTVQDHNQINPPSYSQSL